MWHVGVPMPIELDDFTTAGGLTLDPAEFNNIAWLTPKELKESGLDFETWSSILVKEM